MKNKVIFLILMLLTSYCRESKKPIYLERENSLFPDSVKDSLPSEWFSEELKQLSESSLLDETDSSKTIYRFTLLPYPSGPSVIRVEKVNDSIYYFYHKRAEVTYNAQEEPKYEIIHDVKGRVIKFNEMSPFPIDSLEHKLKVLQFWNAPVDIPWNHGGADGDMYIVEGLKNGKYHVIYRWTPMPNSFPQSEEFLELCNYFDNLYYFYE